jgi:hypothetical protein
MTDKEINEAKEKFEKHLRNWSGSQEGQTDGYAYEKSFVEFMRKVSEETLQISMGELPDSKNKKKTILTSSGKVKVGKGHVLHPGKGFGMSHYLQDMVCFVGQTEVFDEGEELLKRLSGVEVSDKQIERVCHEYGERLEEKTEEEEKKVLVNHELHYAMADGSMILTREKSKDGKSKWAEMKLGRVFKASDDMILGTKNESRKWIRASKYIAHLGHCDEFYDKFSELLDPLPNLVFIADGARWIWDRVGSFHPKAIQILDFFHVMEHLWAVLLLCWKLNFETETQRNQWIAKQKELLLEGQVELVCKNVEALKVQGVKNLDKQKELIQYYTNNAQRMKYDEYLEKGLLIGSGPIESAHRNVIQKRLKRSGQRWTKKGAQQIANLRVAYKSEDWDKVRNLIKIRA